MPPIGRHELQEETITAQDVSVDSAMGRFAKVRHSAIYGGFFRSIPGNFKARPRNVTTGAPGGGAQTDSAYRAVDESILRASVVGYCPESVLSGSERCAKQRMD